MKLPIMKCPVCAFAVCLICPALLFEADASAQQNKGSAPLAIMGGQVVGYHPHCTQKDQASDCISFPNLVSSPAATYSEQARKAKLEGSVVLGLVVDEKGNPTDIYVIKGLGMGLDETATEAVKGWEFEPAYGKDGKPVAKKVAVEVPSHL
jgi:TonB family protein